MRDPQSLAPLRLVFRPRAPLESRGALCDLARRTLHSHRPRALTARLRRFRARFAEALLASVPPMPTSRHQPRLSAALVVSVWLAVAAVPPRRLWRLGVTRCDLALLLVVEKGAAEKGACQWLWLFRACRHVVMNPVLQALHRRSGRTRRGGSSSRGSKGSCLWALCLPFRGRGVL